MRALSIRQPFAELILRGIKTAEYRSRPTSIIGEEFWIYASKGRGQRSEFRGQGIIADNIVVPAEKMPAWMIELAEQVRLIPPDLELPTGVIVGSAVIEKVSHVESRSTGSGQAMYRWHLTDVERAKKLRKPRNHPQPVWFRPFD